MYTRKKKIHDANFGVTSKPEDTQTTPTNPAKSNACHDEAFTSCSTSPILLRCITQSKGLSDNIIHLKTSVLNSIDQEDSMDEDSSTAEGSNAKKRKTSETIVAHGLDLNDYEAITRDYYSRTWVSKVNEAFRVCELTCKFPRTLYYFPDSICNLDYLKSLDLSKSSFRCVSDRIAHLQSLEVLNLNYTEQLSHLPPSIGKLQNLKVLRLRDTKSLSTLPEEIGNLGSLEVLDLLWSAITTIPSSIGNLSNLKELDLRAADKLSFLPEEIWNLVALEELVLTGASKVTTIPSSIGKLQNLRRLFLSNLFQLESLPEEIGNLTSLEYLSLARTKLSSLPSTIGNLQNLRLLSLLNVTTLSDLPIEIGNLANLVSLDLEDCTNIGTLPTSFERLTKLRYLKFDFGVNWWRGGRETYYERNTNKALALVKQLPSLLYLGRWSHGIVGEALLYNRMRFHVLKMERTPGLWPYILKNASTAFEARSITQPSVVAYYYRSNRLYEVEDDSISSQDAIYRLLTIGRDEFVGALVRRRTVKAKASTAN